MRRAFGNRWFRRPVTIRAEVRQLYASQIHTRVRSSQVATAIFRRAPHLDSEAAGKRAAIAASSVPR
jgi:hypothetical protein